MALINCPECGRQMSDTAKRCPNCGYSNFRNNEIIKSIGKFKFKSIGKFKHYIILSVLGVLSLIIVYIGIAILTNDGGHVVLFDASCMMGLICFFVGIIVLYISCRVLKNKIKYYNKIFYIVSSICIVSLIITCLCLRDGITTEAKWKAEMARRDAEYEAQLQQELEQESKSDDTTWQYSKTEDDLTHNVTAINAMIVSKNEIPFDRYGNTARLVIYLSYSAEMGKLSTSVMFCFVDDDNMCRFSKFKGSGISAVFDNGEVDDRWSWIDMVDSRKSIYTYNSAKVLPFVEQLKASKKARIQVNLEHVGNKTFDFNVEGLQWDFEN